MTRLLVGDDVTIIIQANLRDQPAGSTVLKRLPHETKLVIVGGPTIKDDLTWWQVRNGQSGWVAEQTKDSAILLDRTDESRFGRFMRFILREEGGESNHPDDPGGYTKWGLSQRAFPNINLKSLSLNDTKQLYRRYYWEPCRGETLSSPLCFTVCDMAVNAGVSTALGLLTDAGTFDDYNLARKQYYRGLRNFPIAGEGWLNRVDHMEQDFGKSL